MGEKEKRITLLSILCTKTKNKKPFDCPRRETPPEDCSYQGDVADANENFTRALTGETLTLEVEPITETVRMETQDPA